MIPQSHFPVPQSHYTAIANVMMVGDKKKYNTCLVTLKTKGASRHGGAQRFLTFQPTRMIWMETSHYTAPHPPTTPLPPTLPTLTHDPPSHSP